MDAINTGATVEISGKEIDDRIIFISFERY